MPRLIPERKIMCVYCKGFYRTWAGLDWHLVYTHTIRQNANAILCFAFLGLCLVAFIVAELFF